MHVGERLRKARIQRGLTQSELAAPDYSAAYVSVIEAGKREPSERVLKLFAKRLGMTFDELATGRPPDAEAALAEDMLDARRALSAGQTSDAIAGFRRVARKADQFGLTGLKEKASIGEALCYETSGDFERAMAMYERLQDSISDEHIAARADAVAGRARCVRLLGDVPYSTYLLESFLSHVRRSGLTDPEALVRLHITLVASYFEGGMAKQAELAAEEALRLSPRVRDKEKLANLHINVARVRMERKEYRAASKSFAEAEKAFRELAFESEVGRALLARSFLMKRQERYDDARSDLREAMRIFEATGNEVNQARALSELGSLERVAGNLDEAVFVLQRAARMAVKQQPASAAVSHRELALVHTARGESSKAKSSFKRAVDLLESSGDNYELAITYRCWGDALRDEKDYEKACNAYRSAAVALEAA